ncbi:beta-ketoacyl synthase N-terminal-like domain-containing protein [Psychroserpens ponticola]|uniref:Beta-ketoacyl synthase N-terminal-like domain-containing protein n=1 Tax=Psychroserpens ponticola TaxID=2932268 RepID=A0ABY7RXJ9_9FLAO|nr:beta-ketoacyl synthase N-terminal-like domain-containing protein [Psychroserpens ponticola]WCO01487.1 beta-ketoacyl synthase N-terminal-like domain-containing protein [Psychroserpens ponticola]
MQQPISITAISSISPLGKTSEDIWNNYKNNQHCFTINKGHWVAKISSELKTEINNLKGSNPKYKTLDDSVLYAIYASRQAINNANWDASDNFGINIGSSRGATTLFEHYHKAFLQNHLSETLASPTTTLGNISSWVAHDLQTKGPEISHSITCSTALHAMLNGIAWINSGMCTKFLVGGSEAPLTPFTIAQMQALKIYAKSNCHLESSREVSKHLDSVRPNYYPNQALNNNKTENTMILGEGAAMACLESGEQSNALAKIIGLGYATEILEHNASLSTNAVCFQRSMAMALDQLNPDDIDVIVTHTPGTIKGDQAEINAINTVFCNKTPSLTTNKWKIGHSLGASGLLNIEMAILMLQKQEFISIPYLKVKTPKRIKNILVNAVGFGGNAVSILLSK